MAIERFCFTIFPQVKVEASQVIEAGRNIGVFLAECILTDGQRALEQRFSLLELLLRIVEASQVVQAGRNVGIIFAKCVHPDGQRTLEQRFSLFEPALHVIDTG